MFKGQISPATIPKCITYEKVELPIQRGSKLLSKTTLSMHIMLVKRK